jgi:hypothetical protein
MSFPMNEPEEVFNTTELGILQVAIGCLISDHYPNHGTLTQSLEELHGKLDRMINAGATRVIGDVLEPADLSPNDVPIKVVML